MGASITIQITNPPVSLVSYRHELINSISILFDTDEINILDGQPFYTEIAINSKHQVIIPGTYDLGFVSSTFNNFEPLPFVLIRDEGQIFKKYSIGSGLYDIIIKSNLE